MVALSKIHHHLKRVPHQHGEGRVSPCYSAGSLFPPQLEKRKALFNTGHQVKQSTHSLPLCHLQPVSMSTSYDCAVLVLECFLLIYLFLEHTS